MGTPCIMPLGFIDRPTETGAASILTNPEDSFSLRTDAPVTVWRYSPERLAIGRLRGRVNSVGYTTAAFATNDQRLGPDPRRRGCARDAAHERWMSSPARSALCHDPAEPGQP